ncbi:hypothetical protein L6164_025636 [Bauhinia variegata]|uniref:Uncharacterized protein n=1 Tax=Bauhinia variegata TaxID=167791 RepID=A0ACB9M4I9_BAUVA|nr:hypothetical protein L6164_025636 [Bauhinia variegata]
MRLEHKKRAQREKKGERGLGEQREDKRRLRYLKILIASSGKDLLGQNQYWGWKRNREARRTTMAANGLSRRRPRSSSLRDSPEEDGQVELQEPTRLRDRGTGKKDRERERERDRERDRDRLSRSSKRRRGDRLMHSSNREDGGDDTSEESVNDEEEDEDDDGTGGSVRMLPLNPSSLSSSSLLNHRKSFPPAKVFRAAPVWKAADEMIGVSVPRKARSASTKRSHECWASSGGIVAEPIHRQASTSPVRTSASAMGMGASQSPASPSSSNASVRKKIKHNGPKLRPPKSSSSAQDEIEIEIAEVLYGMMRQPQGPTRQEIMANDSREANNKSSSDGKSRVSSPISNSQSAQLLSSSVPPQNSISSAAPLSAVAPKRKRPRPVKYDDESSAILTVRSSLISSTTKAESDQPSKVETCPNFDKNSGSAAENGAVSYDLTNSQAVPVSSEAQPESIKLESNISSDSKALIEESERQDAGLGKEEPHSPKAEKKDAPVPRLDDDREDVKATKANQALSESENKREEKFQIDLMAPPPPQRSSPEGDVEINFVADAKPITIDAEREVKPLIKEDEKSLRMGKEDGVAIETEKVRAMAEEAEAQKPVSVQKERNIDLQLDLEKADRDSGNGNVVGKRHNQNSQRQQQQQPNSEKAVQSNSLPLPMSVPSWPGGLPPMGYMAPLQGLVSMDGTAVSSAAIPPPHLLFQQPRLKRCATHCYIARNISFHQQFARMNPFWPAAAGSASLYGAKPCNLNVAPPTELHGNPSSRAANSGQDKGHGLAVFPGPAVKDKGSQAANMDNAQRKQILLQQALPPGPPSNILHGPAFIFPLNQQQAAAAASIRPGSVKSPPATGSGTTSSTSNAASVSTAGTGAAAAPTMSFSYPNIPGNETQYLAILQNNAYPFPIPAHVGGPPAYRGTHAQALPFFNGSFYSSQMLHPSQLQQQQLPAQSQQQNQQGHQNASISSGSSSSQKHLQNQQQKPSANGSNSVGSGGGGSLQGYPAHKIQPLQPLQQLQQQQVQQQQQLRQQLQNHHASHAARQIESEMGGEDSPSTADSRQSRATMSIYGQNYPMPMQPANFTLMTPASVGGGGATAGANGNHGDKKQSQGPKNGVETSQAFAMSFASINGATAAPGLDLSSFAQNHTILQSHNYQIMAAAHAAQAAHQKKNYRISEEGKSGCDSSNPDDDRKAIGGKIPATVGQSIAFSRPDVSDPSISPLTGNTVIDSSARSLNLGSASSRASVSVVPAATNNNATSTLQRQHHQQQQHHLIQLQKQQFAVAASRSKTPSTSNGSVYSDHLPSTSAVAVKFPNSVSAFPQNLVQSSSTATQLPQWKNSARTTTSQSSSPSLASTPSSSVKALPQQQARTQPGHTQISFAANPKSSSAPQVQPSGSTQSPSPPVMVGSPTTSSMSKSAGSPRTTSTSTSNKVGQASSLSSQQAKNSQAVPSHKSSPVGGRNTPSILSGPQLSQSSGTGVKPQLPQQQQQQQQISKQSLQQAQLLFSNAYMHPQASQSNNSTTTAASGYYLPRRGPEQQQRQGFSGTSSNGMLSLCPTVSLVNTSTSDSSKVVASAASLKGGSLPTQGLLHPAQFAAAQSSVGNHHQFVPPFSYVHAVPSAVQVKPAEQKQPAGE